jgi:hypothetical protein
MAETGAKGNPVFWAVRKGVFKLVKEVVAQSRLPLFIPECGGLQFFVGFRMAEDAHGACCGCPGQLAPPGDN